jgi:quinol monooxygenase YgiN
MSGKASTPRKIKMKILFSYSIIHPKINSMKKLLLLMAVALLTGITGFAQENKNLFVLVKYKTQPGKASIALGELKSLVEKVKKEPHYVNITLLADATDKNNILLYEEWADEAYYKGAHMNTAHLQEFIAKSREFLAGPPDISFWKTAQ